MILKELLFLIYGYTQPFLPIYHDLTTNVVLILRNQSDYSNVIILIGTFSVEATIQRIGAPRMLLKLAEYLFDKGRTYARKISLNGADDNDFVMPTFHYTDDCFKNMAKEN